MAITKEQVQQWLSDTTGPDEAAVRSATAALGCAETVPGFAHFLLTLSAGGSDEGQRVAAATYLKNFIRNHWSEVDGITKNERLQFKNQLVDVLLFVDPFVLKILAEAFRLVVVNDFAQDNTWPELVPAMKTAIQSSDLMIGAGTSKIKTLNVLTAVQTITKPFQYFMNPTVAREPVPEQLERISADLLVPLYGFFHHLVEKAILSKEIGAEVNDKVLHILCKTFHLAVRSHMPVSLLPQLGRWVQDLLALLQTVQIECAAGGKEQLARLKAWKRALQICSTLVTRHRKHVDKLLPNMSTTLLGMVRKSPASKDVHPLQERIISLAFDVISNILETGPGWRLMAPHFSSLLEGAIFPALRLKEKDIIEWKDDEDEYLRKNLPSDLDEVTGWRDDLFTPRRSALNLLGLISTSKGPPASTITKKMPAVKRKKAGKGVKSKEGQGTAGELLVFPFLSQFALPPDGAALASDSVINYYGVMLAYGGLQQFLKIQRPEHIGMLLQTRVLPLYSMSSPCPFVLANANWLLGELSSCLPEELNREVYNSLLKALVAPNVGDMSWRPVRASAAGALSALLQEEYKPVEWLPLLQATVAGARAEQDEEASLSLQLLATAAEAGEENILPHVPAIASAVKDEICRRLPPVPEPWPQVVEAGFSAIAALAQSWDSAEPEEDENAGKVLLAWKAGCTAMANTFSELLQQAWLSQNQTVEDSPPPSCLNNVSVLLALILKYVSESELVGRWKIEELLQVWSDLIAEWSAWDEEEDLAVFEAIEEVIAIHGKFPMQHFAVAAIAPPPAIPVRPRSVLEGITSFISSAIESAYSAATWRACRLSHALLHASAVSFETEEIIHTLVIRFTQAACRRLGELRSFSVPLAKPLVLVIATCFICLPKHVVKVFSEEKESKNGTNSGQALLHWAEALAALADSSAEPGLTMESELKLAVTSLLKLLNELVSSAATQNQQASDIAHKCFQSVLDASVRLKEVQEAQEDGDENDDDDEDDEGSDDNGSDDDDDDDDNDDSDVGEQLEETEEQFLERYARTAQDLEKEAIDEAEGGEEEDGHELEIGVLNLEDQKASLFLFLQMHGRRLMSVKPLPQELLTRVLESFPESREFLC